LLSIGPHHLIFFQVPHDANCKVHRANYWIIQKNENLGTQIEKGNIQVKILWIRIFVKNEIMGQANPMKLRSDTNIHFYRIYYKWSLFVANIK
jgi:hypothetical protein